MRLAQASLAAIALAALPALARADVIQIGGPAPDFTDIQPAIDAAAEGDTLIVWPGVYGPFTIAGKSLTVARRMPFVNKPEIAGPVLVQDLAPDQRVVLQGLNINAIFSTWPGLTLLQNQGSVRIDASELTGCLAATSHAAWPGLYVHDSLDVTLSNCFVQGGYGQAQFDGAPGIDTDNSKLGLYGSAVVGGRGPDAPSGQGENGRRGGPGLYCNHSQIFASDVEIYGGDGGQGSDAAGDCQQGGNPAGNGGNGGNGVTIVTADSTLRFLPGSARAGNGAPAGRGPAGCAGSDGVDGQPLFGAGATNVTDLDVARCDLVGPQYPVTEGQPISVAVFGEPGNSAVVYVSASPAYADTGVVRGLSLLGDPTLRRIPVGTIPAAGWMSVNLPTASLPPGTDATTLFLQAQLEGPHGIRWSGPAQVVLLDPAF